MRKEFGTRLSQVEKDVGNTFENGLFSMKNQNVHKDTVSNRCYATTKIAGFTPFSPENIIFLIKQIRENVQLSMIGICGLQLQK